MASVQNTTTLYFGYGSNLWLHQMAQRCPTSTYAGIALLPSYTWIINSRGYANIIEVPTNSTSTTTVPQDYDYDLDVDLDYKTVVFGLVYTLPPSDERRLDRNEGVPEAYTKENLTVHYWPATDASIPIDIGGGAAAQNPVRRDMLVYIDRKRVSADVPKREYVWRMNRGIEDAVRAGVPAEYVREVMREFIPEEEEEGKEEGKEEGRGGGGADGVRQIAMKQMADFEDGL